VPQPGHPSSNVPIGDFESMPARRWSRGRAEKKAAIIMRSGCSLHLRNALYHWSQVSMQRDPRSRREHYHRLRAKGHSHGRALRGLAHPLVGTSLRHAEITDPMIQLADSASHTVEACRAWNHSEGYQPFQNRLTIDRESEYCSPSVRNAVLVLFGISVRLRRSPQNPLISRIAQI
jgi:hypothetical protein